MKRVQMCYEPDDAFAFEQQVNGMLDTLQAAGHLVQSVQYGMTYASLDEKVIYSAMIVYEVMERMG